MKERKLSKRELTARDKLAKDLKRTTKKQYGKGEGESAAYAIATNIIKKRNMKEVIKNFIKKEIKNLAEAEIKGDVVNLHYKINVNAPSSDGNMSSIIDYVQNNEVINKYGIKVEVGALESGPKEDESSVYVKFSLDRSRRGGTMTAIRLLRDVVIEFIEKKIGAEAVDIEAKDFKPDGPSDTEYDQMAKDAKQDDLMRRAAGLGYLDLEEGDTYEKMAAKGKKRGNLKQGTVRKRLKIKDGEKIPLSKINQAISRIKKMENPSEKNKKFLKALNLAKTLKTTTNVNELKEFDKPEDIKFDVKSLNMLYTDFGKFYGFYVYSEPNLKGERNVLRSIDDANEFLKSKGINIIMLPGYDEESLDKIATALKGQGIDAEYGDYMDVS